MTSGNNQAIRRLIALLSTAAVFAADGARAQMTLRSSAHGGRGIYAYAIALDESLEVRRYTDDSLGVWIDEADAYVEVPGEPQGHYAHAYAFQASSFFPGVIYAAGHTSGDMMGSSGYTMFSLASGSFGLDQCVEFVLDATLLIPDPANSSGWFILKSYRSNSGFVRYYCKSNVDTTIASTFRLSPGRYEIYGYSVPYEYPFNTTLEFLDGPTYEFTLFASVCPNPLIAEQPISTTVNPGGTAVFSVVPSPAAGGLTFQWWKNGEPLADDGRIAGATTSTLSIHQVAAADTGYYDVTVDDGAITEYSSLVQLSLNGAQGIGDIPVGALRILALEPAAPNPFRSSTGFRYTAQSATPATIAIYDAAGRLVRPFGDRVLLGPGVVSWDGRTASGAQAPAGVYFLRLVPGSGEEQVRRVTLVR